MWALYSFVPTPTVTYYFLQADLRSPLSFFATIMAKNMTMAALDAQFRNNSMLSMVAEYLCRFPNIQRPASDLLCREFPIDHSTLVTILVTLAFTLLVFVAVVGNLLVMWIIGWHKVMHRGFNYFLFNLAFADFLIALLNVCTTWTYNFYYDWWFGGFCAFNQYFGVVPTCVSVFTMMVVSWDR
uniref:G-protein coupled receptors family 1 profile domain-containing protein n=1 Tax=Plectus sambesii TaxID=2011161 RepID=A0A914WP75_9BILA